MSRRAVVDLPQPLSPTTPSVSPLSTSKIDAVDGAHHRAACRTGPSLHREVLHEAATPTSSGCAGPPRSRGSTAHRALHDFTSIADRSPSDSMLNAIDVMKIITPGSAATSGCE